MEEESWLVTCCPFCSPSVDKHVWNVGKENNLAQVLNRYIDCLRCNIRESKANLLSNIGVWSRQTAVAVSHIHFGRRWGSFSLSNIVVVFDSHIKKNWLMANVSLCCRHFYSLLLRNIGETEVVLNKLFTRSYYWYR